MASASHEAFELALGPGQRLLHRFALEVAHDHLGLHALQIDLPRDLWRGRRRRNRQRLVMVRVGIVVEGALGGPHLRPGLEALELGEGGNVVALARLHHLGG